MVAPIALPCHSLPSRISYRSMRLPPAALPRREVAGYGISLSVRALLPQAPSCAMTSESLPVSPPMLQSAVPGLARLHQGKVRDIYTVDEQHLLIVTTD